MREVKHFGCTNTFGNHRNDQQFVIVKWTETFVQMLEAFSKILRIP